VSALAAEIVARATAAGLQISMAESCTGGLVCAAITDIAGSSRVFERGFVTYSNEAKAEMLGVSRDSLERFGAVSEEVARDMAEGALSAAKADIAVSITGIAGPGGSEFKPEGRVCFGLALKAGTTRTITRDFGALGRDKVRTTARDFALSLLADALAP